MNAHRVKGVLREGLIGTLAPVSERAFRERPRVRVLCFHDVEPGPRSPFPAKMRWLAERYRVVPLERALTREGLDGSRLNVALSFDDGYAEHATFAAPILHELGLPATFFVPSGAIDLSGEEARRFAETGMRRTSRRFAFMTSSEVAQIAAEPLFEIGAHTTNHVDLGAVRDRATLANEIGGDKSRLEALSGATLRFFAFPFGGAQHTSPEAREAIEESGFAAAFTIMPGYWSSGQERYLVGRDSLAVDLSRRSWEGSLRGGYDAISLLKLRRDARRRRVEGRA
jgi:peptidoglycan/xylan/chitin deacetylase (PgdA/CDA1 family)